MYVIKCDNYLLLEVKSPDLRLVNASAELELNKAGTLKFTIMPDHPYFNKLEKLKSIITVWQGADLIFRGRILNEETGWRNSKVVICEGELAFLVDSIQRPYDFTAGNGKSVAEIFTYFITEHNKQVEPAQRFIVGNCTVTDPNNYIVRANSDYSTTWQAINEKLLDSLGGYLFVRHETTGNYIDYLADFTATAAQPIEFGKNLLDFDKVVNGEDVATVIIPLGAKDEETEKRLTVESVNAGKDYIEDTTAIAKYGRIVKTVYWDDVTVASNLLTKARAYLASAINLLVTITLNAFDLSAAGSNYDSFRLGYYVNVYTRPHNVQARYLVKKLSIDLLNPESNKLVIGTTYSTFTEQTGSTETSIKTVAASAAGAAQAAGAVQQDLTTNYYNKTATDNKITETAYTKTQVDEKLTAVNERITNLDIPPAPYVVNLEVETVTAETVAGGSVADCQRIVNAVAAGNYNLLARLTVQDTGAEIICPFIGKAPLTDSGSGTAYIFDVRHYDDTDPQYYYFYRVGFSVDGAIYTWFYKQTNII